MVDLSSPAATAHREPDPTELAATINALLAKGLTAEDLARFLDTPNCRLTHHTVRRWATGAPYSAAGFDASAQHAEVLEAIDRAYTRLKEIYHDSVFEFLLGYEWPGGINSYYWRLIHGRRFGELYAGLPTIGTYF